MNTYYVPTLQFFSGVIFYAAVSHALVGLRRPINVNHLLLSTFCLSATISSVTQTRLFSYTDIESYMALLPWNLTIYFITVFIMLQFVAHYTGIRPKIFLRFLGVTLVVMIGINLVRPYTILFEYQPQLHSLATPWGELISLPNSGDSPWVAPGVSLIFVAYGYVIYALVQHYRRIRNASTLFMACSIGIYIGASIQGTLVRVGYMAEQLPLGPIGLAAIPLAMSIALSHELRQAEQRQRAILDHVPAKVHVKDLEGRYVMVNSFAAQTVPGGELGILDHTDAEIYPSSPYLQSWRDNDNRVLMSGQAQEFEEHDVVQGELQTWLAIKFPLHNAQSKPIAICGVCTNITQRKKIESELKHYQNDLELLIQQRTRALEQKTEHLQQAMGQLVQSEKLAALGSLVAGVAHELNTPIGNAVTVVTTLQQATNKFQAAIAAGPLRRSQLDMFIEICKEACELLESNTRRAADLVTSFKQVAIDQTGMQRRHFELDRLVAETLLSISPLYSKKPVEFMVNIPSGISFDSFPGALEQVLTNLVGNAIVHGLVVDRPLKICISAYTTFIDEQPRAVLELSDDGRGMEPDVLAKAFDPFFTTKLGQGGSGLGLYLVHNLVTGVLGGTLSVRSELGHGVQFALTLPLHLVKTST